MVDKSDSWRVWMKEESKIGTLLLLLLDAVAMSGVWPTAAPRDPKGICL